MNISMITDNDAVLKEIQSLGMRIQGKTEIACNKMADVIRPALIRAAPYDKKNKKSEHLKNIIVKTKPRYSTDSTKVIIWISPRGDDDKNIYKLVVSEYGRSDMAAKPFWTPTVVKNAQKSINAGVMYLKKELIK